MLLDYKCGLYLPKLIASQIKWGSTITANILQGLPLKWCQFCGVLGTLEFGCFLVDISSWWCYVVWQMRCLQGNNQGGPHSSTLSRKYYFLYRSHFCFPFGLILSSSQTPAGCPLCEIFFVCSWSWECVQKSCGASEFSESPMWKEQQSTDAPRQ